MSLIAVFILIVLSMLSPIPQDVSYHDFVDTRMIFTLPNFWNVISNLPFLFVGVYALKQLFTRKIICDEYEMKNAYMLFFLGLGLVALGSGYYHLNPNNDTLLWDRLPMAVAFMALFSIVIAEFIAKEEGKRLLYPLVLLGIISVIYWAYTESLGEGDLRLYIFVQFFPMIIIPLLLLGFRSSFTLHFAYWYLLLCYLLAKIFEYYDEAIYEVLGFISGHSLKHMIVALGLFILIRSLCSREFICDSKKGK
jgi:hypothetical protein